METFERDKDETREQILKKNAQKTETQTAVDKRGFTFQASEYRYKDNTY